jgi:hypothetical protein
VCRGYAGWLTLNPQFIGEQQDFYSTWRQQIRELNPSEPLAPQSEFAMATRNFLDRWHLESLAGPFLPVPISLSSRVLMPRDQFEQLSPFGALLFLPTIFPLPERQMLCEMVPNEA